MGGGNVASSECVNRRIRLTAGGADATNLVVRNPPAGVRLPVAEDAG